MGNLGNALILSPFATHPLDAGQRKRAYQTTALLQEWGFSITFLHFAFETRWYWGHNSEDDAVMKEQWDGDVLHFYANKIVGQPPVNGESHQLDEWWDEALGGYITNIFSKRQFDLFVVHNIWLSKAFDYAPYHCLKVLEMHDLFSQRAKEFEATGVAPEFFHCSEKDELFGLRRADILFAIKQEDADWCLARELGKTQVMTIPYVEANCFKHPISRPKAVKKPLHPGKVIFGMIGSDIHFNRHAAHQLIKELDAVIQKTYAPIEFVLAGSICKSVGECPVFVKKLGFVNQVEDFYSAVDVVMVPMLNGTGVKIKSVEALGHKKAVLFTAHSAEGTGYKGKTFKSISDMARDAAAIALDNCIPRSIHESCCSALELAEGWIEDGQSCFLKAYRLKRPSYVQVIAPTSARQHKHLADSYLGLYLHKILCDRFRCIGLGIHNSLREYIPSVSGCILPYLDSKNEMATALDYADIVITAPSQLNILLKLSTLSRLRLLIFDLRSSISDRSVKKVATSSLSIPVRTGYLVSQSQAGLLSSKQLENAIILPITDSRCDWDPHLKSNADLFTRLYHQHSIFAAGDMAAISKNPEISTAFSETYFHHDSSTLIREAVESLSALLADSWSSGIKC